MHRRVNSVRWIARLTPVLQLSRENALRFELKRVPDAYNSALRHDAILLLFWGVDLRL